MILAFKLSEVYRHIATTSSYRNIIYVTCNGGPGLLDDSAHIDSHVT